MAFTVHAVMPGVWHIVDCMGVCMTLLEGENAAMLVDTGYGIEDVADFMRHMTDLPLTVFLTHNHHDHAMGHAASGNVHAGSGYGGLAHVHGRQDAPSGADAGNREEPAGG